MDKVIGKSGGDSPRAPSLLGWLTRPLRWSLMDWLLLAGLLLVACSLAATPLDDLLGDVLLAFSGLACAGTLVLVFFRRMGFVSWNEGAHQVMSPEITRKRRMGDLLFWCALLATVLAFGWLFLANLFINEDPNPEAMDCPMTVHFMEKARFTGRSLSVLLDEEPMFRRWREQDPEYSQSYKGRFRLLWVAQAVPLLNVFCLPFVKVYGVGCHAITLYSTFYATLAWLATGWLAWRVGGRWCAVLALNGMTGSLGWLIHVRIGYQHVTPSVLLMVALGLALHQYTRTQRRIWLAAAGVGIALMYLVGWIVVVFGILFATATVLLLGKRRLTPMTLDAAVLGACAALVALVFPFVYGAVYGVSGGDVHRAIGEIMFGRFQQGEPGLLQFSLGGKALYAFRCLFIDSRTMDGHVDKYLEGAPAIPWLFSVLLLVGLLYAIKERDADDRGLLLWLLAVLGVVGSVFIYGHRYALMALPAMSIVAARGAIRLWRDLRCWRGMRLGDAYGGTLAVTLALTIWLTHQEFYVSYLREKPANFELDRLRGYHAFAEWLGTRGLPGDTLVVLGDPIMFSAEAFVFNTFDRPRPWLYWTNLLKAGMGTEGIARWEREQLEQYSRIVYAFSPIALGNPQQSSIVNDWSLFLAVHPNATPVWTWSYANRPPAMLVFEVFRQDKLVPAVTKASQGGSKKKS